MNYTHEEFVARYKAARQVDWDSFRHNWPMLAYDLAVDFAVATLLGAALGFSVVIFCLEKLA